MNYVQLHLGDWIAGTLDLTPTERGVYMDLLVRYYKEERPLMQDECKRIARGYAPAEQEAMHYVLQRFFTLENGEYRQSRCDEEIEKAQAVSNKRKRAAASRWAKKPEIDASAYPNAEQVESNCNANGMLTNNQEPITNNQDKNIYAPSGASVSEDQKTERPSQIKKPADVSKEDWANYLKLRKQKHLPLTALALQEMEHEAEKAGLPMAEVIRICLTNSWAGFKASWLTKPQHGSQKQPVMQQTSFADLDYSEGINPDGTF